MPEDLSYLRTRLDEACNGIARLEEQVKNLFHRYEETVAVARDHAALKIDVTTQESRLKALEATKEKGGNRMWEIVAIIVAAIAGAFTGKWLR